MCKGRFKYKGPLILRGVAHQSEPAAKPPPPLIKGRLKIGEAPLCKERLKYKCPPLMRGVAHRRCAGGRGILTSYHDFMPPQRR